MIRRRRRGGAAAGDRGSAVVEFAVFTVVAIVPLAWSALALQHLASVHHAAQVAAGESLRAFLTSSAEPRARQQAELAAALVLEELPGVQSYDVSVTCEARHCLRPGTPVRVDVQVQAELPQIPVVGLTPTLTADAEQYGVVDAFVAAR